MSPRTKEANRQILDKRREQILSAAAEVFAKRGFAATKISDIAEAAGLSHGLIYHYFKTKEDVFTELFKNASGLKGISEYISQSDLTPWEKIKSIVELIFSTSLEGEGLHYWNIINQAYISEAVPENVKKLLDRSHLSNLLIPLIIEGQKLGQIAPDDPLKLDTALRSALNGLAVQAMRAKNTPGYPISLPDADVVMRILAKTNEPSIARNYKRKFGRVNFLFKHLTYRLQENGAGEFIQVSVSVTKTKGIYRIEFKRPNGEKCIVRIQSDDSRPLSRELFNSEKKTVSKIEYRSNSVQFDISERDIHKEMTLNGEYYDGTCLPFDLQGFPFESDEKIKFRSVTDGRDGSPVGPFVMEAQKVAREIVTVPAGRFECYKLQVRPGGLQDKFGDRFKYFYWYAAEEPHFWVKSEDMQGNLRELVKLSR